jgi:carboxymethylenebutenolidase
MRHAFIDLFDSYTHGGMTRRAFLRKLRTLAGSAATAALLLPLLENNYARAAIIAEKDPRIVTARGEVFNAGQPLKGYLARPAKAPDPLPAVLVIHENRGLNPHIEDMTRRFAVVGFLAFAPDLLTPFGGTPADPDAARDLIYKLDDAGTLAMMMGARRFLAGHSAAAGPVGAVGFCWGGGKVNELAVGDPELAAAVSYYGPQPPAADVPKIQASLLLHYAGLDERIDAGIAAYETALKIAGKDYTLYMYEGVNHAFNNDTNAARYDEAAAALAWSRTIAFFKEKLSG